MGPREFTLKVAINFSPPPSFSFPPADSIQFLRFTFDWNILDISERCPKSLSRILHDNCSQRRPLQTFYAGKTILEISVLRGVQHLAVHILLYQQLFCPSLTQGQVFILNYVKSVSSAEEKYENI